MDEVRSASVLIIASEKDLWTSERIWGHGGWLPPEDREALDWLTLVRILGWDVETVRSEDPQPSNTRSTAIRWILIACGSDSLDSSWTTWLASRLTSEPLLVVMRAPTPNTPFARLSGVHDEAETIVARSLTWVGPGRERRWICRRDVSGRRLVLSSVASPWALLDGAPVMAARRFGKGTIVSLGFHPSAIRDEDGAGSALLKHLLIWGADSPVAWLDLEGTLVLRMDDPGGAPNVHSRTWSHRKLGEADWVALGEDLRRRDGRMSVLYVGGWVDDGDPHRGELRVAGELVRRIPGRVYPSPDVQYRAYGDSTKPSIHDYEAEFRGIQRLRARGAGDVELHGFTHVHADSALWARSPDRYDTENWFRDLGVQSAAYIAGLPRAKHPLTLGINVLSRRFGVYPTTLVCPGDQWTTEVLERAVELGLHLVDSYYLAIRHRGRFCWTQHVCAPYLDRPDASWFDSGLPVVGYFHDRDVAVNGLSWFRKSLDGWTEAGASRLLDFRELATALGHRIFAERDSAGLRLVLANPGGLPLPKPLQISIRYGSGPMPPRIVVVFNVVAHPFQLVQTSEQVATVRVPVSTARTSQRFLAT